jgi:membrane-associated phospholipid phosphatase
MDLFTKIVADNLIMIVVLIGAITFIVSVKTDRYQRYGRALMAGLTALMVGKLFSLLRDVGARPFEELGVEPVARTYLNNPGFPSDHALLAVTVTLVVWAATHRTKISLLLAVLSILVAIGRVTGLVHAPADVIGGAVAAFIGVGLWYGRSLFRKTGQ